MIGTLNENREHIYVAELKVPTCFYPSNVTGRAIDNPTGFEISKGYYAIRPPDEESVLSGYPELLLVVQFVSPGLKGAEDHASKVGGEFSSMASAYGAYPLQFPYLHRIARIGVDGYLKSQHSYGYRGKPYVLSEFDQTADHQFRQYLQSISSIEGKTRYHLQSAIHWYGLSISSDDPTVSYVAAWTGLECLGKVIDSIVHPNGPRVRCQICKNEAGKRRDRKKAGITHILNRLADGPWSESLSDEAREMLDRDFLGSFTSQEANCLRNSIVHGLDDKEPLVHKSSKFRRRLVHALNVSIERIMGQYVKSWIPGEFGFYPDIRQSLKFKGGLNMSPYHGEWAAELRSKSEPAIRPDEGVYTGILEVEAVIHEQATGFIEFKSEELFKRDVDVHSLVNDSDVLGLPTWHNRSSEPKWKEYGDGSPQRSQQESGEV